MGWLWSMIAGRILVPFLPWVLGGLMALGIAGTLGGLWKGYQWASEACQAANNVAELKAKEAALERYRTLLRASEMQRATEAAKALDTAAALGERAQELEAASAQQEAAQRDLEADLAAAIQDKGTLNAIVQKTRASARTDCRASDADVRLDGRLRGAR